MAEACRRIHGVGEISLAEQPPPKCQFFRLPQELRDVVYTHSVTFEHSLTPNTRSRTAEGRFFTSEPPLACDCKQMRREVLEIYYTKNVFRFNYSYRPGEKNGLEFTNFHKRHLLRNVHLQIPISYTHKDNPYRRDINYSAIEINVDTAGDSKMIALGAHGEECTCELVKLFRTHMEHAGEVGEGSSLVRFIASYEATFGTRYNRIAGSSMLRPVWLGDQETCGDCGKRVWKE